MKMNRKAFYTKQERELANVLPHGSGIDYDWSFSIGNDGKSVIAENAWHYMDGNGYYLGGIPFSVKLNSDGSVDNIFIDVDELIDSDLGDDIARSFFSDESDFDEYMNGEKASASDLRQKEGIIDNEVQDIIDHLYGVFEGINAVELGEAVGKYIANDEIADLPKTASRRRIAADDEEDDNDEEEPEDGNDEEEPEETDELKVVTFKTSDKALIDLLKGDFAEITIATDDDEQTFGPESFGDLKVSDDTETKKTASIRRKADIEMLKPGALSTALGTAPNKYFSEIEKQLIEAGVPQNNATGIKEWLQGACEGLETVDNTLGKTERDFNSLAESYKSAADYCTEELKQTASSKVFASYFNKASELFKKAAAKFAAK